MPSLKEKQSRLAAAGVTRSLTYIWLFENGAKYNWVNPNWAQKPEASNVLGRPCQGKCGSKIEPWHWQWEGWTKVWSNTTKVKKPTPGFEEFGESQLEPELDEFGESPIEPVT